MVNLFSEVEDKNGSVGGRCADLVATAVPADLENAASALVGVNLRRTEIGGII